MDYAAAIKDILSGIKPTPQVYLHSFGCRQNVSDGNSLIGNLLSLGFTETTDINTAALIIYNTCAVRDSAEKKAFGYIGELSHIKARNPDVIIAVCGCMVQQEHMARFIHETYKYVDFCFGTFAYEKFPEMLFNAIMDHKYQCDINEYETDFEDFNLYQDNPVKAEIPIMYGCDNFCSYCIVPYVRGRERSRPVSDVLSDIRSLAYSGYKEIMLLGQNVNAYGKTLSPPVPFEDLLKQAAAIPGEYKLRFMSPHPMDMRREVIDVISDNPKICRSIHLPLQSGSNRILELMNRQYTREQYLDIVKYIRKRMPNCMISTDIIVGFPGETEADFEQTLEMVREVKFYNIFTFIYSKREGTKAAAMEDFTPSAEKKTRIAKLLTVQREISTAMYKGFVGQDFDVLFDGKSRTDGKISGKSDGGIIVEAIGSADMIGEYKKVHITKAFNWAVEGTITD
jgi:tRNA-2-methylthio-N6-dimethylallyladenosine synthase